MKKALFVTLLGTALAVPFAVHAEGFHIGGNIGQGKVKLADSALVALSTSVTRETTATAFKVYGGYEFTRNWGVELGYADLGKINNIYHTGVDVALDYKTSAFYLAGTGTVPVSDQFSLFGKLGITSNKSKVNASVGSFASFSGKDDHSGVMFGVGAAYHFTKNIAMTVEYDDFGKTDESGSKASMWSLGMRYKF
ncbi:MAG: outer membrane beta-barrel protein [Pseudomonadota bacterium]